MFSSMDWAITPTNQRRDFLVVVPLYGTEKYLVAGVEHPARILEEKRLI
jgi:hypothetical protein